MTRQYSFDDKNLIERTLCELFPPGMAQRQSERDRTDKARAQDRSRDHVLDTGYRLWDISAANPCGSEAQL